MLDALPALVGNLSKRPELCVLEAPPGSGKTILAPFWLLEKVPYRRVLVLVPRRVNARLPVLFLERSLGSAVGYRIRFESRWDEARLKVGYLTYGTALRSFADSPPGPDDLVIFDEFHERPWEADLLLACLRAREAQGPSLLLMSATVDTTGLPQATPLTKSDGRLHPVTVTREEVEPMLLARPETLVPLVARRSAELAVNEGEQLIFLPGISAIRAVENTFRADSLPGPVDLLHSSLPEEEIRRVVERPACAGFRRILSTDIAESSVTLPGVTTVIDAGLQRRPRNDPFGLGITLETVRAPLSSLTQRAGRAGRLRPGHCHRLLSHQDELHRRAFAPPEIVELEPKTLALHLAALGCLKGWRELPWLTPLDSHALEGACSWLDRHGLLNGPGLSSRGRRVLRSSCTPRAGLFGVAAVEAGWSHAKVVDWVYAMESGPDRDTTQTRSLMDLLGDKVWMRSRDTRLLQRLQETFASGPRRSQNDPLLTAFSDTLVEIRGDRALPRQPSAEALLLRAAHPPDSRFAVLLSSAPAGKGAGPVSMATLLAPVSEEAVWEELIDEMHESARLEWDGQKRAVKEVRTTTLGALVIEESVTTPPPGPAVAGMLRRHLSPSDLGDGFAELARRLNLFLAARPTIINELATRVIVNPEQPVEGLLGDYLGTITRWSKSDLQALPEHVKGLLGYAVWRELESALPTSVQLPGLRNAGGGLRQRTVMVHYPEQGSPYVASKLQDFFGWKPPQLLDGSLRLACHLLAPSGRPVQITEDLEGFWKGSYQQVRKDLRGRYPKHAWPENP